MLEKLLITGAGGALGTMVRPRLGHVAKSLRVTARREIPLNGPDEELMIGDLADAAFVDRLVEGCDGVLHLGGVSVEQPFAPILQGNIVGMYNLYDAAQKAGQPRILFASSNHAIGYHPVTKRLDANSVPRPDGLYGVSKVFGEALATMYFDKLGQETAIVRIGSCYAKPKDHRMLSTWLSPNDFISLISRVFQVKTLGCPIIYGASDNDAGWWDNSQTLDLGWVPKDNSEHFRAELDAKVEKPAPDDIAARYQGGSFAAAPIRKD
ncbi:NAD-dependent epimerase/dehydratase family protein [Ruegeria sp. SCP11]|uniref:NAD-dependent epimerase/dehydratase family protein n=1 Tax=Ruegeria sp. SCP11 TaxID=3141378 RepID=UPI00333678FE